MYWAHMLLLLLIPLITSKCFAQESEVLETTTLESNNVSDDGSSDSQVQLDSNLRSALLKALSELEGDDNGDIQEFENEKNIKRAQASAITYVANEDGQEKLSTSEDEQDQTKPTENLITTTIQETTENFLNTSESGEPSTSNSENASTENAVNVLVQKSFGIHSGPIAAIEKEPLDFFKDAEQIITSASNSFLTQNGESVSSRSVKNAESNTKVTGFSSINTISDSQSKILPKEADDSPFVKTYVRPLGNFVNNDEAYVKPKETHVKSSNVGVNSKSSVTSEAKRVEKKDSDVKTSGNGDSVEATTKAAVEVSTEESEAKVEQVQFFSAPLVAAFTVHQDEKGQPKKVEPIFKNELNPKKEQPNSNLQSSTLNNFELQKKQQILEQELEKLRNQQLLQQQNLLSRNNLGKHQGFSSLGSDNLGLTQSSFNQAVKQNFNQFDPIFTEPDRSIVTKLATIDPNTLLSQNGGPILNKFTPSEAILASPAKPTFVNKIVPDSKPNSQNPNNNKGEVSLVSSIAYDPIIESEKLPLNAQILPNKEPTGFLNFVPVLNTQNQPISPQIQNSASLGQSSPSISFQVSSNPVQPSSNFAQTNSNFAQSSFNTFNSNALAQAQKNLIRPAQNLAQPSQSFLQPTSSIIQPSISNFASSTGQTQQSSNFLGNQAVQTSFNPVQSHSNRFSAQGSGVLNLVGANNEFRGQNLDQNNQFLTSNRILRQEQGSANLGLNQNTFSIIQSQQPFNPSHETSYFPDSNRFLRQNQGAALPSSSFAGQNLPGSKLGFQGGQSNFFNGNSQNQNRPFRSNFEGSQLSPNNFNIQQSVQPFGQQILNDSPQSNRIFRSNQEGTLGAPQNFGNGQNIGLSQSQVDQNNRFLRSNQESTFLSNQNRFSAQPIVQSYKYSSPFGFPTIPLN